MGGPSPEPRFGGDSGVGQRGQSSVRDGLLVVLVAATLQVGDAARTAAPESAYVPIWAGSDGRPICADNVYPVDTSHVSSIEGRPS